MIPIRMFLLSPAHCGGKRAGFLLNDAARFDLAQRIRQPGGITLGETFSFLSGLYFRGKLAYATRFARPPEGVKGALVLTTNRGLLPTETPIDVAALRALGAGDIDPTDETYRAPLLRDATALAEGAGDDCEFVLLGSIATGKYVDILSEAMGGRLRFPSDFVGRGDMSRGGLMLRRAASGEELNYEPIAGAIRNGKRPARLDPIRQQSSECKWKDEPDPRGGSEASFCKNSAAWVVSSDPFAPEV